MRRFDDLPVGLETLVLDALPPHWLFDEFRSRRLASARTRRNRALTSSSFLIACQPGTFFLRAIEARSLTVRLFRSAAVITISHWLSRQSIAARVTFPPSVGAQLLAGQGGRHCFFPFYPDHEEYAIISFCETPFGWTISPPYLLTQQSVVMFTSPEWNLSGVRKILNKICGNATLGWCFAIRVDIKKPPIRSGRPTLDSERPNTRRLTSCLSTGKIRRFYRSTIGPYGTIRREQSA